MTQRSLAATIGVNPSRLSKYLNGHSDIHSDTLLRIVKALGLGFEEWLDSIAKQDQGNSNESMDRALFGAVRQMEPADRRVISSYVLKYASALSKTKSRGDLWS
jgi:plasmid maintenance system antidote protein VapI